MTKFEAKKKINQYLKEYNINNRLINDHQRPMLEKDLDTFYLYYDVDAPGGIESDILLYDDYMDVRAYYSAIVANKLKKHSCRISEVTKVINLLNANVFFKALYTPRLYLSTDGFYDLAITTVIPYCFFESKMVETLEYITCYYPECMEKFAVSLCGVVFGELDSSIAIKQIEQDILGQDNGIIED